MFNFFKSKDKKSSEVLANRNGAKSLISFLLLPEKTAEDFSVIASSIAEQMNINLKECEVEITDGVSLSIHTGNGSILLYHMPAPIPNDEIADVAQANIHTTQKVEEALSHKSHYILTVLVPLENRLMAEIIRTDVTVGILKISNAAFVFLRDRTVLTPKELYIDVCMAVQDLPIHPDLWIYYGIKVEGKEISMYTFGLHTFGKRDFEILRCTSVKPSEVSLLLRNLVFYVLQNNISFSDGETIGGFNDENEKIPLKLTTGEFVQNDVIRIMWDLQN